MRVLVPFLIVACVNVVSCRSPPKLCYNGKPPKEVKCESWNYKDAKCPVKGGDITYVYLNKQESKTDCKQGGNWGFKKDHIWVKKGCRAVFQVCFKAKCDNGKQPKEIKCESWKYKNQKCQLKEGKIKHVYLYKQESKTDCKKGDNWDFKNDFILVKKGCRAVFHVCFKGVPKSCLANPRQDRPCRRPNRKVAWIYDKMLKKCRRVTGCYKYSDDNVFRNAKNCERKCNI